MPLHPVFRQPVKFNVYSHHNWMFGCQWHTVAWTTGQEVNRGCSHFFLKQTVITLISEFNWLRQHKFRICTWTGWSIYGDSSCISLWICTPFFMNQTKHYKLFMDAIKQGSRYTCKAVKVLFVWLIPRWCTILFQYSLWNIYFHQLRCSLEYNHQILCYGENCTPYHRSRHWRYRQSKVSVTFILQILVSQWYSMCMLCHWKKQY